MGNLEGRRRETPSPKPKVSPKKKVNVLERRKAIKRKYRNQMNDKERKERSIKEVTKERKEREREKSKKEKKATEDSSDDEGNSIAKMLKLISSDIKEMKGELRTNNEKIDNMNKKITKLELRAKENEDKTERRFKDIQQNLKEEIKENNATLEETISKSIIDTLKPKISAMHNHSVETDLIQIVREQ